MVKNNQSLQIRLTEPVIFLKGPSTGLDFRGRPQAIAADAQPAMLRGLLTLRLSKPTRIRKIDIKLEGKTRTEWPEGIGPRRMETSEEHILISEKTTYFNAIRSESKSDVRRTASMGPGVSTSHFDVDDHHFAPGTTSPVEYDAPDYVEERGRSGQLPRSASVLPGSGDGWSQASRQQSTEDILQVRDMSLRDRGPSPAYTPRAESHEGSRRSSLRNPVLSGGGQPTLSPIASVPHSRAPSERTDSTSTERRRQMMHGHVARSGMAGESLPEGSASEAEDAETLLPNPVRPSILEHAGHRHGSGEVRFAESSDETPAEPVDHPQPHRARTGSLRTINSNFSASTSSLATTSTHEGRHHAEPHPVVAAIRTAANSPIHSTSGSPAPSIRAGQSTEDLRRISTSSSGEHHPSSGNDSSRRSSLGRGPSASSSALASPSISSAPNQEVRQGKRTRIGSGSTIVINKDMPGPSRPSELRQDSNTSNRSASLNDDDRQHRHLKFSIANALGAVKGRIASKSRSRAESRNASRGPSRSHSRAPSFDEPRPPMPNGTNMSRTGSGSGFARVSGVGSAVPAYLQDDERTNRFQGRDESRGSGRSRSSDRTASPARQRDGERSPSRNRGRHKGMKVLTGALGAEHEDEEHLHNWKEFKKGVYNYPISFPIPVNAPPTLHAEFGSVVYRLKATVVRVGALTSNLVEDVEVMMIATPQEDDLEETENVIVERQWEEQMRYQIALHGKAFPIGGIIPVSVRLMPLMKCKIHRLTVALEEKTDYFAQEKKVARHETPKKFTLLFVKQPDKLERVQPLLPIISDDPNAAKESPVAPLAAQAAINNPAPDAFDPTDEDAMYASLLDPLGPWHLEKSLQLPDCASTVKFTTKHEKTNIAVGHWLKVIIRVERGDDVAVDAKGRRKQFDIIIETPIKILDCRVNPQINSLPTYTPIHPTSLVPAGVCSIHLGQSKKFTPIANTQADPLVAAAPTSTGRVERRGESSTRGRSHNRDGHHEEDTLLERNIVYDRLMSGQETETGDTPPTYGEAVASAIRSASRSESRNPSSRDRGREGIIEFGASREESTSRSRSRLRRINDEISIGIGGVPRGRSPRR